MRFRHYAMLSTMTGLALTAAPAMAADYGPAPPVYFEDQARSCFYLRGDVGGAFHTRPDAWQNRPAGDPDFPAGGVREAIGEDLSSYGFFEAGVGCQLVENMRFDITGGYRLKGSLDDDFDVVDADWQAFTGFFNVYWDITNYGGFTPYLGGGVGVAHHRLTNVDLPGDSSSGSNTDFAWNITAGLSYDVAPGLLLDVAYRFVDLGSAKSGGPLPFHVDDLQAHEVKLGMRYYLGSF